MAGGLSKSTNLNPTCKRGTVPRLHVTDLPTMLSIDNASISVKKAANPHVFSLGEKENILAQHTVSYPLFVSLWLVSMTMPTVGQELIMQTTRQNSVSDFPDRYHRVETKTSCRPIETALILCDVWDSHHCVNAVRRVQELAPRIDALVTSLRSNGATIIHAPSDCMAFYETHPARNRAKSVPASASLPKDIASWCDRIPSEESIGYPIDQSDGGEDDTLIEHQQWTEKLVSEGRNPKAPWRQQIPIINIDANRDFISDSGNEIWNILETKGIKQILICGVHTNMCVLGRPFGLRQLSSHGKNVLLIRDLTDTMYNPLSWPYVNHFSGTDLIIDHIERYVCPTTTSDQIFWAFKDCSTEDSRAYLKSPVPSNLIPFRFSKDRRPHLAMIIAEDEYETARTLPQFAAIHLMPQLRVSTIYGDSKDRTVIPGIETMDEADALLISVRRRPLKASDMARIQAFVKSGRPVIGIRTASHAFCLRDGKEVDGLVQWPEFDAYTFGGNYSNHHGIELHPTIQSTNGDVNMFTSQGSLYKVSPLKPGTRHWLRGTINGQPPEPVAWTYVRADGGPSFYTSLGHAADFAEPQFQEMLANAVLNICGLESRENASFVEQQKRYVSGKGRQRR